VNCRTAFFIILVACSWGLTVSGCSVLQEQKPSNSTSPSPTQAASPSPSPSGSPSPVSSASPATSPPPVAKTLTAPDLTVEKLKNAEYFFLAKGPVKLVNGKYEDPATKRVYTLGDVVTYGDLNKDGIKDAVAVVQVTIPDQGDFVYLVSLINDNGNPRNISAEFLGPQMKVKTLTIKPDQLIEVQMDQYERGGTDPIKEITQSFKLKDPAASASPSPSPSAPPASPAATPAASPKS
jgi:hypothetical protein